MITHNTIPGYRSRQRIKTITSSKFFYIAAYIFAVIRLPFRSRPAWIFATLAMPFLTVQKFV